MKKVNGPLTHVIDIKSAGITAIIGSGGKSTLLRALGLELMRAGSNVLLATTTHMYPVAGVPWAGTGERMRTNPWARPIHAPGCTCEACMGPRGRICQAGTLDAQTGKMGAPQENLTELATRYDHVLVEADGSHRLPLKAHAAWEPVIPEGARHVIWVVGASGFGRPVREAVHRPQIFCELAGIGPDDLATPEAVAHVLSTERTALELDSATVLVNQVDGPEQEKEAERLETALGLEVLAWGRSMPGHP